MRLDINLPAYVDVDGNGEVGGGRRGHRQHVVFAVILTFRQ